MGSSRTVVSTGKHVEMAMHAADACVASMIGQFVWSSRQVTVPKASKGEYMKENKRAFYPLAADVEIKGKVGTRSIHVRVALVGIEDLDGPDSVHLPDDVSGPQFLGIDLIRVRVESDGSSQRRAFELDDIPGASVSEEFTKMPERVI